MEISAILHGACKILSVLPNVAFKRGTDARAWKIAYVLAFKRLKLPCTRIRLRSLNEIGVRSKEVFVVSLNASVSTMCFTVALKFVLVNGRKLSFTSGDC